MDLKTEKDLNSEQARFQLIHHHILYYFSVIICLFQKSLILFVYELNRATGARISYFGKKRR